MGGRGASHNSAKSIVKKYSITQVTDSKEKILDFFRDIDKNGGIRLDYEKNSVVAKKAVFEKAQTVADELVSRIVEPDEYSRQEFEDMRSLLKGTYTMSARDRHDIPDFSAYARSKDNFVKIGKSGMSIDSAYQELAERYPHHFDAQRVTHPADQLQNINSVMKSLKNSTIPISREDRKWLANEIKKEIIGEYGRKIWRREHRKKRK